MAGSTASVIADELNVEGRPISTSADMLFAAFFGWLLPRRAAARTWNGSLWWAWIYHFVIGSIAFVVMAIVIPWIDLGRPWEAFDDMAQEFERHFWEALGIAALCVAGTEAGFVVLAALVMPWGCRDEPLGRSFASALRQTWLHTTHVLPAFLIGCGLVVWQERADYAHRQVHGTHYDYVQLHAESIYTVREQFPMPGQPKAPVNAAPDSPEMAAYNQAFQEWATRVNAYHQEVDQRVALSRVKTLRHYHSQQPFLLRHGYVLIALAICLLAAWVLWSLIRAVATPRPVVLAIERDPMCEFCGYNLRMTPMESRCPECGVRVVKSVGEGVRGGPPLTSTATGWLRGYGQTVKWAAFEPRRLGRMLPTRERLHGHGVVFTAHMFVWVALVASSASFYLHMEMQRKIEQGRLYYYDLSFRYVEGIAIGGLCLFSLIGAIQFWALLVALWARWQAKRNLGHVAMAMASHASGLLLGWTAVLCAAFVVLTGLCSDEQIMRFVENPYVDDDLVLLGLWGLPSLVVVLWYGVAVVRGTMAARWANR
jgi:hypothetical protein